MGEVGHSRLSKGSRRSRGGHCFSPGPSCTAQNTWTLSLCLDPWGPLASLGWPAVGGTPSEVTESWTGLGAEHFLVPVRGPSSSCPFISTYNMLPSVWRQRGLIPEMGSVPRASCFGSSRINLNTSCCLVTYCSQSTDIYHVPFKQKAKNNAKQAHDSRERGPVLLRPAARYAGAAFP